MWNFAVKKSQRKNNKMRDDCGMSAEPALISILIVRFENDSVVVVGQFVRVAVLLLVLHLHHHSQSLRIIISKF